MWMQRISNMLPSPVVVQQDAHHTHTVKTENNIAGFDTEKPQSYSNLAGR